MERPVALIPVPADRFPSFGRDPLLRKVDSGLRIMVCGQSYSLAHIPAVMPGSLVQVFPDLPLPEQTTAPAESPDARQQSTSASPRRFRNQGRTGPKSSRPVHSGSVRLWGKASRSPIGFDALKSSNGKAILAGSKPRFVSKARDGAHFQ